MDEERYKLIKENVYTRCYVAEYTGIGISGPDKEEIELIDYVEELKDQLQQKENILKEVRDYVDKWEDIARYKLLEMLDKGSDEDATK